MDELEKISNLLSESYTSTFDYFSNSFKRSPYNIFYEDFSTAFYDIFENDKNYTDGYYHSFEDLIDSTRRLYANVTLDSFLDYLEFFKTLLQFESRDFDINANQIKLIIDTDCEKIGYSFVFDESTKTYRVMLKNPEAEAFALNVKVTIRDKIYKYLMIRTGRVEEKRECIKSLADDVENICKKYSNIAEYDKLKQFIQCCRHTKDSPKKEFPFYYKDEEKWLDKTFDMIIGVLSFTKTKEIVKEIKDLENKEGE